MKTSIKQLVQKVQNSRFADIDSNRRYHPTIYALREAFEEAGMYQKMTLINELIDAGIRRNWVMDAHEWVCIKEQAVAEATAEFELAYSK